ncbi:31489_t:CDS:1, partial [Racocetra persica]
NNFEQSGPSYDSAKSIMNSELAAHSYDGELAYSNDTKHSRPALTKHESFSKRSLDMLSQEKQDELFGAD